MGAKVSVKIRGMAEKGDMAGLKKMVDSNSKINASVLNAPGSDGSTALLLAAKNNHKDIVKLLLDHDADPYAKDVCDESAVTYAASSGYKEVLEVMVESKKVDLNHDPLPLIATAASGNVEMTEFLISKGADPSKSNEEGETPLVHAVIKKHHQVIKTLLAHECDPNKGAIAHARFPLHASVSRLYMDRPSMLMLVDAGADINFQDKDKWTVLHQAVSDGSVKVIGYLMENGANPDSKDINGKTPIDLANEQFDDKNIIHAQLAGEVVDMNQESKVWNSVNTQEGAYAGGDSGSAVFA